MAVTINTNIASLNAQGNLSKSQASLATSLQRLSSGLRINSAKDDAAGMAIAARFTSQINGNTQAARNANDGISLAQTAEGGLSTAGGLLQRVRELAVQSANGSNSNSDRKSIQNEVSALTSELNRVANTTQFNGQNVLDGSLTNTQFQVGANANQTISIGVASAKATDLGNNTLEADNTAATDLSQAVLGTANQAIAQTLTISSGAGISTPVIVAAGDSANKVAASVNALSASSGVTAHASTVATISGIVDGAAQFTLRGANSIANDANSQAVTISAKVVNGDLSALAQAVNAQTGTTNVTASITQDATTGKKQLVLNESAGNDINITNVAVATGLDGASIRGADKTAAIGNTPAVAGATVAIAGTAQAVVGGHVSFSSDSGFSIASGGDTSITGSATAVGSNLAAVSKIDVSSVAGANAALLTIDSALNQVNSSRAALGAIQNRFASTISNLQTTTENLSASQSRIQDTDFASETASLTRGQILQQAGTAMLAQANSLPNGVLALLRG
ncbi:flagellin [Oxalobacteraceae bacterium GrIS 1.11]